MPDNLETVRENVWRAAEWERAWGVGRIRHRKADPESVEWNRSRDQYRELRALGCRARRLRDPATAFDWRNAVASCITNECGVPKW
jgi:hypothetical protein